MSFEEYVGEVQKGFVAHEKNGCLYFSCPSIENTGYYKHGFFSRKGGVSTGFFDSLNFSRKRENNIGNITKNYHIACEAMGVGFDTLTVINYEHGKGVVIAKQEDAGMGITRQNMFDLCDGMVVTSTGVTAVTIHADCMPMYFADKEGKAAGACHAGWKGVYLNIASEMIDIFKKLGVARENILVGIAPFIDVCCFEVKDDVSSKFIKLYKEDVVIKKEGKQYLDLGRVVQKQLYILGIPPKNVTVSGLCTCCSKDLFYSYRRDKGNTGAMASFICINK